MLLWYKLLLGLAAGPMRVVADVVPGVDPAPSKEQWALQVVERIRTMDRHFLITRLMVAGLGAEVTGAEAERPSARPDLVVLGGDSLACLGMARRLVALGYRVWVDRWTVKNASSWLPSWRAVIEGPLSARVVLDVGGLPWPELAEPLARRSVAEAEHVWSVASDHRLDEDFRVHLASLGVVPGRWALEFAPFGPLGEFEGAKLLGRDGRVAEVLRRVETGGLTVVTAPTGSGLSSFFAAGLGPALRCGSSSGRPWSTVSAALLGDATVALARALTRDPGRVDAITAGIRASDQDLQIRLRDRRVALLLTGLEEHLLRGPDASPGWGPVLRNLVPAVEAGIPVFVEVRAELCAAWLSAWQGVAGPAPQIEALAALDTATLEELMNQAGVGAEPAWRGLLGARPAERLVQLCFSLASRPPVPRELDRVLDELADQSDRLRAGSARQIALALEENVEDGGVFRCVVPKDDLDRAPIQGWVDAGLVVEHLAPGASPGWMWVHDRVLSWPRLVLWRDTERAERPVRRGLAAAAAAWDRAGRAPNAAAGLIEQAHAEGLSSPVSELVRAYLLAGAAERLDQAAKQRDTEAGLRAALEAATGRAAGLALELDAERMTVREAHLARELDETRHSAELDLARGAAEAANTAGKERQKAEQDELLRKITAAESARSGVERALRRSLQVGFTGAVLALLMMGGLVWQLRSRETMNRAMEAKNVEALARHTTLRDALVAAAKADPGVSDATVRTMLSEDLSVVDRGALAAVMLTSGGRLLPGVHEAFAVGGARWERREGGGIWRVNGSERLDVALPADALLGAERVLTGAAAGEEWLWYRVGADLGLARWSPARPLDAQMLGPVDFSGVGRIPPADGVFFWVTPGTVRRWVADNAGRWARPKDRAPCSRLVLLQAGAVCEEPGGRHSLEPHRGGSRRVIASGALLVDRSPAGELVVVFGAASGHGAAGSDRLKVQVGESLRCELPRSGDAVPQMDGEGLAYAGVWWALAPRADEDPVCQSGVRPPEVAPFAPVSRLAGGRVWWSAPTDAAFVIGAPLSEGPVERIDPAGDVLRRWAAPAGDSVTGGSVSARIVGDRIEVQHPEGTWTLPISAKSLRLSEDGALLLVDGSAVLRTDPSRLLAAACTWVNQPGDLAACS